jgi:putative nucleotidyltransferase with HDIG domain
MADTVTRAPVTADSGPNGQRSFRFLQTLAAELSAREITFPTFVEAALKVRLALNDPDIDLNRLARIISGEPLLAAKVVRLANSAALNPGGHRVADVRSAVTRVGFGAVRATAAAFAMQQLRSAKELAMFADETRRVHHHSLDVAAIAYVLARSLTRLSAEEAMFAGLVHDIGRFYLLARAAREPDLLAAPAELAAIVDDWHPSIGESILASMDVPEPVRNAVAEHESSPYVFPPRTLRDVVVLANLASHARDHREGAPQEHGPGGLPKESPVFTLLAEATAEVRSMVEALG